jgi:hypothetical protein
LRTIRKQGNDTPWHAIEATLATMTATLFTPPPASN